MDDGRKTMLKIIIAGDCQVGKTTLSKRYSGDEFSNSYLPTISPKYSVKEVKTNGRHALLQIWDTSGREEFFDCLGVNFYRDTDCCVLVYDITNKASFEALNKWFNEFLLHANPRNAANFPFVVVGTKSDLNEFRKVPRRDAEQWCLSKSAGARNFIYMETSAKNGSDVKRLFAATANHVLTVEQQQPSTSNESTLKAKKEPRLLGCCCNIC